MSLNYQKKNAIQWNLLQLAKESTLKRDKIAKYGVPDGMESASRLLNLFWSLQESCLWCSSKVILVGPQDGSVKTGTCNQICWAKLIPRTPVVEGEYRCPLVCAHALWPIHPPHSINDYKVNQFYFNMKVGSVFKYMSRMAHCKICALHLVGE